MRKEVTCPYCGCEMIYDSIACQYECPHCGSRGPDCNSFEEAYHETRKRFHLRKEPLKPLTFDEVMAIARFDKSTRLYSHYRYATRHRGWTTVGALLRDLDMENQAYIETFKTLYGRVYVLFESMPTEAEREAVEWLN